MLHDLAKLLVDTIFEWGYYGIFIMMAIESSFIPFPSEIVLIPAGYLASQGDMNIFMIMLSAVLGSMVGAFINYYLAFSLGRTILLNYGKYFFVKKEMIWKMEDFFEKHGHISTFTGRLIPAIRQLISIPAGLSKMHIGKFAFYTMLGASLWALILTLIGYYIGENQELIEIYLKQITIMIVVFIIFVIAIYYKKSSSSS